MILADYLKDNPSAILIVGVALVGFYFMMKVNRRGGSKGETILTPEEQIQRLRESKGMHGDLETLMTEIEDLAKRLEQRLDAKSERVEKLLADIDRRIAELSRLQGQAPAPGAGAPPSLKFDRGSEPSQELPNDPLSRSVYELADAGHAPPEIARRLNEQVGKVELILALRRA